jgi:hypothetical protein
MKRKHSYRAETARAAIRVFQAAGKGQQAVPIDANHSLALASAASDGATKATIYRWLHSDMSDNEVAKRLSHRGRHSLLSDEQQCLVVGYFIHRRQDLLHVDRSVLIEFCKHYFNYEPIPQMISDIISNYRISSQKVLKRTSRMTTAEIVDDALEIITEIRAEGWKPHQIIVADETGIWSNVSQRSTYHFVNWYELVEISHIDTIFAHSTSTCLEGCSYFLFPPETSVIQIPVINLCSFAVVLGLMQW